jgi:hypothetical protein
VVGVDSERPGRSGTSRLCRRPYFWDDSSSAERDEPRKKIPPRRAPGVPQANFPFELVDAFLDGVFGPKFH